MCKDNENDAMFGHFNGTIPRKQHPPVKSNHRNRKSTTWLELSQSQSQVPSQSNSKTISSKERRKRERQSDRDKITSTSNRLRNMGKSPLTSTLLDHNMSIQSESDLNMYIYL